MEFYTNEQEVKRRKTKKVILYSIILATMILIAVFSYLIYQKNLEKRVKVKLLTFYKCMSLCPIQIEDDPLNSSNKIRWFDSSCLEACNNVYLSSLTKASKIDQEKLSSLQEFGNCFNNVPKLNFDYQKCFNDFFTSHKNITDLSNFKLPDYIKYDFTITNLVCNENSAKITIKTEQGTDNLILSTIANKKDGLAVVLQPSNIDAPKVGETKEYALTYPSGTSKDDITHIKVFLGTKERAFIEDKAKAC